jgi:hypothetical protein
MDSSIKGRDDKGHGGGGNQTRARDSCAFTQFVGLLALTLKLTLVPDLSSPDLSASRRSTAKDCGVDQAHCLSSPKGRRPLRTPYIGVRVVRVLFKTTDYKYTSYSALAGVAIAEALGSARPVLRRCRAACTKLCLHCVGS